MNRKSPRQIDYIDKSFTKWNPPILVMVILLSCCGLFDCNNENQEEPFSWANAPVLQFVTYDWQFSTDTYAANDTISIGFVDYFRGIDGLSDTTLTGRVKYCTLNTTSGDTESVIFDEFLPGFWPTFIRALGGRIESVSSSIVQPYNGILEVHDKSYVNARYVQPLYEPPNTILTLTSRIQIKGVNRFSRR